jgi:DNA-binding protein YbaB
MLTFIPGPCDRRSTVKTGSNVVRMTFDLHSELKKICIDETLVTTNDEGSS